MKSKLLLSKGGIGARVCLSVALALVIMPALYSPVSAKKEDKEEGRAGNWKSSAQGAPSLEACRKRATEHADDADAQNDYGWALRQNGDAKGAEAALRAAVKLNTNLGYAHSNLSVVLLDVDHKDEAVTEGKIAVTIDPKQPIYHVVLGNALAASGDTKAAISEYENALKIRPDYENALYNLGRVLGLDGQTTEAKVRLSQALSLDPGDDRVVKLLDQLMK